MSSLVKESSTLQCRKPVIVTVSPTWTLEFKSHSAWKETTFALLLANKVFKCQCVWRTQWRSVTVVMYELLSMFTLGCLRMLTVGQRAVHPGRDAQEGMVPSKYCLGFPGDLGGCCCWNWDILPGIKAEAQRLNEDSAWVMMAGASPLPVSELQLTFQDVHMLNNRIAVVVPVLSWAGHWIPHLAPFFWQCTDLDPNVLTQSADSPPPPPPADSLHSSIPPKFPLQMPHLENHSAFNNREDNNICELLTWRIHNPLQMLRTGGK